jgi:hypothetical protein
MIVIEVDELGETPRNAIERPGVGSNSISGAGSSSNCVATMWSWTGCPW